MKFLGIDIGSTWLKSAILDPERRCVSGTFRLPAPAFAVADRVGGCLPPGAMEIAPEALAAAAEELIRRAAEQVPLAGILFSVQMHGFALWSETGEPVTNYVTWQDMRGAQNGTDGSVSVLERLRSGGDTALFTENGITLQPNHSVVPLVHLAQERGLEAGWQFSMLGDTLVRMLTGGRTAIHVTNAASSGLYSLQKMDWNRELIRKLGLERLDFPAVTRRMEPVALYACEGQEIPLYTAVGDQQASVKGMGAEPGDAFLNIATGGQIGIVTREILPGDWETRPYFGGSFLRTYTQMPAGRRLQELHEELLQSCGTYFGEDAPEKIWAFMGEPGRAGDEETPGWTAPARQRIRACYHEMAAAYGQALEALNPGCRFAGRILAGGGALLRNPALCACLEEILPGPLCPAPVEADSMAGLMQLAAELNP